MCIKIHPRPLIQGRTGLAAVGGEQLMFAAVEEPAEPTQQSIIERHKRNQNTVKHRLPLGLWHSVGRWTVAWVGVKVPAVTLGPCQQTKLHVPVASGKSSFRIFRGGTRESRCCVRASSSPCSALCSSCLERWDALYVGHCAISWVHFEQFFYIGHCMYF